MRQINYTNRFKRDYKREKSGRHGKTLDVVLMEVVNLLAADELLPRRNQASKLITWPDSRSFRTFIRLVNSGFSAIRPERRRIDELMLPTSWLRNLTTSEK